MKIGTLCYVRRNGRTLMMLRNRIPGDSQWGRWNGLGGKMEPGETPEECVKREIFEESGLRIDSPELKGFLTFPAFDDEEDWYVFLFEATSARGELIECPEGRLEWIEDERIASLPLMEGDHLFLSWMRDGRFFSGRLAYGGGRLRESGVVFYPLEAVE